MLKRNNRGGGNTYVKRAEELLIGRKKDGEGGAVALAITVEENH